VYASSRLGRHIAKVAGLIVDCPIGRTQILIRRALMSMEVVRVEAESAVRHTCVRLVGSTGCAAGADATRCCVPGKRIEKRWQRVGLTLSPVPLGDVRRDLHGHALNMSALNAPHAVRADTANPRVLGSTPQAAHPSDRALAPYAPTARLDTRPSRLATTEHTPQSGGDRADD
jgi:hypothetical protein